ncbi:MAG: hypothetical protein N4J56_001454 [Chroococcidiopsis sp. SAG 2025]|nr:hypothetical protein [Chroococcidiopsis sp. SAG 2025]
MPTNGAAIFNNALDIQNILSRVTGGSISNIDGLIRANGAANLFLLNPNGIIFGQNARLDVGGSFIATTASSINFADGTQFSATPGTGAPLLTVSVPLGLQFGTNSGSIINRASNEGLQVGAGTTLGLVGGNVNLEGGRLTARGGQIELGAVAAPGVVEISPDSSGFRFSFPTDLALGDISLTNLSVVDVAADRGGSIATNSQNLSLAQGSNMGAGIRSGFGSPDSKAGNIEINAIGRIALADGSFITNSVQRGAVGNSGDLNVTAGTLELIGGGQLEASTYGKGNAGNMNINANSITFSGVINQRTSGILSNVEDGANGTGGIINVKADSLSLTDGGQIQAIVRNASNTLPGGNGNAGKVVIDIRNSFDISDINGEYSSAVFTFVGSGAEGKGGDIDIKTRSLSLSNGGNITASTFGVGDAGSIKVEIAETATFSGVSESGIRSGIFNNVGSGGIGKGGSITLNAGNLSVRDGGQINTSSEGGGSAGNITIDVEDRIAMDGVRTIQTTQGEQPIPSGVFSSLFQELQGDRKGGDINITARSLSLADGGGIAAGTFGQGNAGNINIDVSDTVFISGVGGGNIRSGIFSNVERGGKGKGGNVNLKSNSLSITDAGIVTASTLGQGDAGSIVIEARDNIFVDRVRVSEGVNFASGVFSIVGSTGVGRGGNINIKARSLSLTNGGNITASTYGQGDAGRIKLEIIDTATFTGLTKSNIPSGLFSNVYPTSTGKGGDITLNAGNLFLRDGAQINTVSEGRGSAGNITIDVKDRIAIDGVGTIQTAQGEQPIPSGVFSNLNFTPQELQGDRKGGDINIKARAIDLTDGGNVNAGTYGQGDAGSIKVEIAETATFTGLTEPDIRSGIFNNVGIDSNGKGGDITLNAGNLFLRDGAQINTVSEGRGSAGNIAIDVKDRIAIDGVHTIQTAQGEQTFASGVFSSLLSTTQELQGERKGGDISIKARSLFLSNSGQLNSSSAGQGDAGDIDVDVRSLELNYGGIFAQSLFTGNGGDIELRASKSVRLRNGSQISTSAGGLEQGGNGGNITINSPLVIANANGNNDITANAFRGSGGKIEINAQGIFGLTRIDGETLLSLLGTDIPSAEDFDRVFNQLSSNDVVAISLSDPSLSGNVSFNTADIDPSRDIVELPTGLVDASSLVAAGCPSGAENRFTVAGRGGLPPAPADKLSSDALLTDWATLQTPDTQNRAAVETTTPVATNTTPTPPVETITEATSWQYDRNGAIILTSGDTTSSSHLKTTPTSCPSS